MQRLFVYALGDVVLYYHMRVKLLLPYFRPFWKKVLGKYLQTFNCPRIKCNLVRSTIRRNSLKCLVSVILLASAVFLNQAILSFKSFYGAKLFMLNTILSLEAKKLRPAGTFFVLNIFHISTS